MSERSACLAMSPTSRQIPSQSRGRSFRWLFSSARAASSPCPAFSNSPLAVVSLTHVDLVAIVLSTAFPPVPSVMAAVAGQEERDGHQGPHGLVEFRNRSVQRLQAGTFSAPCLGPFRAGRSPGGILGRSQLPFDAAPHVDSDDSPALPATLRVVAAASSSSFPCHALCYLRRGCPA